MRAEMRAAAVTLLEGYKTANDGALRQVYKARPLSIATPSGFVDSIDESELNYTPAGTQRTTPSRSSRRSKTTTAGFLSGFPFATEQSSERTTRPSSPSPGKGWCPVSFSSPSGRPVHECRTVGAPRVPVYLVSP
jgi:hypothetical protein